MIVDTYQTFINSLIIFPWESFFYLAKIIALMIAFVALILYIRNLFLIRSIQLPTPAPSGEVFREPQTLPREVVSQPWDEIQKKMASPNPSDWAAAIIQADAILDKILRASGYVGDTMADRLRQINPAELNSIQDVWDAHKVRNRIAHGVEGRVSYVEAQNAIAGYEKAFRELNYIV